MGYFYIATTIVFTVYGQLILKWRVGLNGDLPVSFNDKIIFLLNLLMDPWILSGFLAAFFASLSWMATMTKFELSFAYPFMSFSFIFVLIFSVVLFDELISWQKIVGMIFIISGIVIASR